MMVAGLGALAWHAARRRRSAGKTTEVAALRDEIAELRQAQPPPAGDRTATTGLSNGIHQDSSQGPVPAVKAQGHATELAAPRCVGGGGGRHARRPGPRRSPGLGRGTGAGRAAGPVVHGLGLNPADGDLYTATHFGLFRVAADGVAERVGESLQDTMGFTVVGPDRFVASGHPDIRDRRCERRDAPRYSG